MLSLVVVYVGLGALAPLLALAQHLRPAREGVPSIAVRARSLDWAYWLVTPLFSGLLSRALIVALGAMLVVALGAEVRHADDVLAFFEARSILSAIPSWSQLLVCLLLVDLLSYWSHRLRHRPLFFPLHAVHHSSRELDWLAAARMHPLDEIVDNIVISLPILLLGPAPWVFLVLGPITLLYTLVSHAAVELPLGPLRFVIVGPAFHRAHHALDAPGVNYAGMFSLWDLVFGTFRDPLSIAVPQRFGVEAPTVEDTLRGHVVTPVRRVLFGDRS
ncbi:MAG: sterol desaturase family protein [Deltaproteobacteria bacterium]|nr:sterol desaturase family protein [Deltaproteobacteria bacterium]